MHKCTLRSLSSIPELLSMFRALLKLTNIIVALARYLTMNSNKHERYRTIIEKYRSNDFRLDIEIYTKHKIALMQYLTFNATNSCTI